MTARTRFRFTPRALLVALGVVGVVVAWALAFYVPEAHKLAALDAQRTTLESTVTADEAHLQQVKREDQHIAQIRAMQDQLGEYLPKSAVLNGVNLLATTPTGGSGGSPITAGSTVIGTGSTTVYTHTLTEVTQFGLTMSRSPALSAVDLSGSVGASSTAVSFPITFSITKAAHSQRTQRFSERLP